MNERAKTTAWLMIVVCALVLGFIGGQYIERNGLPSVFRPAPPAVVVPPVVAPVLKDALIVIVHNAKLGLPEHAEKAVNDLRAAGRQVRLPDFETVNGLGEVPAEVKPAIEAAKGKSLPFLALLSGGKVLKAIPLPTTPEAIQEACK